MSNTELPFTNEEYRKHERAVFPTLRRRDKYGDEGDIVTVTRGLKGEREQIGRARIVAKELIELQELPTSFFAYDTNVSVGYDVEDVAGEAKGSIDSFYQDPIEWDEQITLYWLVWVSRNDGDENDRTEQAVL